MDNIEQVLTSSINNSTYLNILDDIPIYIVKLDLNMNIIWANKYAIDAYENLMYNKCFYGFNYDNEQCVFCPASKSIKSKISETSEIEVRGKEDNYTYEVTTIPYFDENKELIGIFEIRKNITQKLDYQNIKSELNELTKIKHKKELFKLESIFDTLSIELNDLVSNAIKSNDKILKSTLNKDQKSEMLSLRLKMNRMYNILHNIDLMKNINSGLFKISKKKMNLKDIVVERFSEYQSKVDLNGNIFNYKYDSEIPKQLIFDKELFDLIILNLIDYSIINSINRHINLIVTILDDGHDYVKLSFVISNVGSIDIHDLVQESYENYIKSNLGLSVSRSLIENLNGNFKIIPASGYGVDISVELSFNKTLNTIIIPKVTKFLFENKTKKLFKSDAIVNKKTILIAEDEVISRMVLEKMLKGEYNIIFAKNGKRAVDKYFDIKPDLVIMDIMMPIMNGFDAYDQIERNCVNRVPIIACTSKVINSEKEYLKSYGFDDYIGKPFELKELKDLINKYI